MQLNGVVERSARDMPALRASRYERCRDKMYGQGVRRAVDLCPDSALGALAVRIHRLSSAIHDAGLKRLSAGFTATQAALPHTDLPLVYEPVGFNKTP